MRQLGLVGLLVVAACGAKSTGETAGGAGGKSLYERLGGKEAITGGG